MDSRIYVNYSDTSTSRDQQYKTIQNNTKQYKTIQNNTKQYNTILFSLLNIST